MIDGGPSVLYDAVALLPSSAGSSDLLKEATAHDFVSDAFVHCKFIGYVETALPLMQKAGSADSRDEGVLALRAVGDVAAFVKALGKLRVCPQGTGSFEAAVPVEVTNPRAPIEIRIMMDSGAIEGRLSAWSVEWLRAA